MFRIVLAVTLSVSMSIAMLGCETGGPVNTSSTAGAKKPAENILPRIDPKKEKSLVSPDGDFGVTLTVKNKTKSTVTLHWLDETDGSRVYYKEIQAGGEVMQGTYEGHYWIILDKAEKALGIYKTPGDDGVILIK
ncbi:MAG: hypothetical protein QGH60_10675 [Phycisphaerae bacterium]|jgi:hypothetical protein|nr:hypothetical protein [Phycisphaerae bacterium]